MVIGLLVKGALASLYPETERTMIDALWFAPILGGKGSTDVPLTGLIADCRSGLVWWPAPFH